MLSQLLAVVVGLGSITLYLAAFFFPEVHRRHDFFWSGVGLFYSLVLWFGSAQMSPTEFLGHLASVSLLGWLGWQTLTLRRRRTPLPLQTPFTEDSWPAFRRELVALSQDFLRQTPLGRWLPDFGTEAAPPSPAADQAGLRASSLKEVGYEFLDELEPLEAPPARLAIAPQAHPPIPGATQTSLPSRQPLAQRPTPSERGRVAKPTVPPLTGWQKGQVLVAWVGDLWASITAPKPKKPVIEIPPRSPSMSPKAAAGVMSHQSQAVTPDDRSELDRQGSQEVPSSSVTIVDTEAATQMDSAESLPIAPNSNLLEVPPQALNDDEGMNGGVST